MDTFARELSGALAKQLGDRETAGVYSLGCSAESLRRAVEAAGFKLFDADLKGVKGKQNLLNVLAAGRQGGGLGCYRRFACTLYRYRNVAERPDRIGLCHD